MVQIHDFKNQAVTAESLGFIRLLNDEFFQHVIADEGIEPLCVSIAQGESCINIAQTHYGNEVAWQVLIALFKTFARKCMEENNNVAE